MTEFNPAGLSKLDEASQYREQCEVRERKIKRVRNFWAIFFASSIVLIIASNLFMEPPLFARISIKGFSRILPAVENISLAIGIISLVLLVVSVVKSINIETQAAKARKTEGTIAQNLFKLVLMNPEKY